MRKGVMAIAAAVALGAATMATGVTAAPHGSASFGGGGGGGMGRSVGGGGGISAGANFGARSGAFSGPSQSFSGPNRSFNSFSGPNRSFSGPNRSFSPSRNFAFNRGFNHGRFRFRHGRRFAFGFFGGPLYDYDDFGCWRLRRVWTPWGWRWRRIYVCY